MAIPNPNDSVVNQYEKFAAVYDKKWSSYLEKSISETLARLPISQGRLLDIGCGTGLLLESLANQSPGFQLFGIDPTAAMLAVAKKRVSQSTTLIQAWAEALPFDAQQFDPTISCNMFHFIKQPESALAEIHRVLKPDGYFVITDWCDDYWTCKLCDLYLRITDPAHVQMYNQRQCRGCLEIAGFEVLQLESYKISWLWGLMTVIARPIQNSDKSA